MSGAHQRLCRRSRSTATRSAATTTSSPPHNAPTRAHVSCCSMPMGPRSSRADPADADVCAGSASTSAARSPPTSRRPTSAHDGIGPLFSLCADAGARARIATELAGDFIDLRSAGTRLHAFEAGLFAYARALAHWHARTRFCGACGAPLDLIAAGTARVHRSRLRARAFPARRSGDDRDRHLARSLPARPPGGLVGEPLFDAGRFRRARRIARARRAPRGVRGSRRARRRLPLPLLAAVAVSRPR